MYYKFLLGLFLLNSNCSLDFQFQHSLEHVGIDSGLARMAVVEKYICLICFVSDLLDSREPFFEFFL